MKRKRFESGVGSLELLLDTICNTFGGILLISLLVAVLLNATSKAVSRATVPPGDQAALLSAEIEREQAERDLDRLRTSATEQAEVAGSLLPADLVDEAQRFDERRREHADLVSRKGALVGDASQAQLRINELNQDDADRAARLEQARHDAGEVAKQLAEQVAVRTRELSIPRLQQATSSARAYFVVRGRLFGPWQLGAYGRESNDTDFEKVERDGLTYLEAKSGGGVEIPTSTDDSSKLSDKFADIDKSSEHAKVFVWPDSYGHFDVVRQAIAQAGVKLELIPMTDSDHVSIGNAPQGPAFVQ